ncbi:antitoxin [Brevibacterium sp. 50QC2O2]|jgi:hypothetical protein|uniref:antitoxin n=1 Tax=Brevibacterium TaxID=1696 RepID=UPI00211B99D3|nr:MULTISPECIES: antitoxin [unclassified Brevibacterium]MCQ9369218.1 antitoxin [Brevibacterium sp. 91QC2O2]MCQ9386842.1 antitoxin [Brevibacterium sp. 68QC2CO]MCQ9387339.1 antitoxin [Brevibacterium sp. 50QC2O2]
MGIEDFANKAKDALDNDQVKDKVSGATDSAAEFAKDKTGGKFDEQIDGAADTIKGKLGGQ